MRFLNTLLALGIFTFAQIAAADTGYKYLKPTTYDQSTKLTVAGKSRTYFIVDNDNRISATVEGPSKLKIMSRLKLQSESSEPEYSIEVMMEGSKKARTIHHTSKLSEKAESPEGDASFLGVLRAKVIDIPSGKHNVIISVPAGSSDLLYVRLSQKTNDFTGGTPVIAMTPFEYSTEVDLVADEEIYPYYRISGSDRAALRLVGPATLKVLSRIEFAPEMKGNQKWKVKVLEDGKLKKSYSLSASQSDVIKYHNPAPLLPSRAETFYVEIPEGEHVYEFRMDDDPRSALLRFLMPKTELNGEKN